jgi:hypothetical protein
MNYQTLFNYFTCNDIGCKSTLKLGRNGIIFHFILQMPGRENKYTITRIDLVIV